MASPDQARQWVGSGAAYRPDQSAAPFSYDDQIQSYLGKVNAKVETFNFSVEKNDRTLAIDCQVKAVTGG